MIDFNHQRNDQKPVRPISYFKQLLHDNKDNICEMS